MKRSSLKTKMTLAVFVLVFVLMSTTAFFSFRHFEKEFRESVSSDQFAMVSSLARETDDKLTISRNVLIQTASRLPPDAPGDPEKAQRFLDGCREALSIFDDGLFLFDPTGRLIAQTPFEPGMRGRNYSFREYFKKTAATDAPSISAPYRSTKRHNHPSIMFTVPLFDPERKAAGILAGSIDLTKDNFLGAIATTRIGRTGYFYIFTPERTLVIHPDRKRILETVPAGKNAGFDRALKGFESSLENVNSSGLEGISSFKRLRAADWIMGAHYPTREAYDPIRTAKRHLLCALVGASLLAGMAVWLTMRLLTAPLLSFTRHVATINEKEGEGKFVGIDSRDEIQDLAEAFNVMVAEIEKQRSELRKSKELYQLVADFSSDMAFWRSPAGPMVYVSPRCEQITGYTEAEYCADPGLIDRIIHADDRERWVKHQGDTGSGLQPYPLEFRIVTKGGEVRWVSHFCRLVHGERGELLGVRGSFSDITLQKRMQEILEEEKAFAENLINSAAVPIFVLDAEHRILFWNRACEELTGFRSEDMIGTCRQWEPFYSRKRPTLSDIVIDGAQGELPNLYTTFNRSPVVADGLRAEGWYCELGGKSRYIYFDAVPVRNARGELVAVIETFQEITERKEAEENVIRLRDFYLTLFEEFPALIWRSGTDASCDYFNRPWLEFTGRRMEEEVGNGWAEGVHPDDLEGCLKTYLEAFESRAVFEMEYRLRRHDGEYRWILDHGRPFRDPEGNFAGYIGVCYDITERRRSEEQLRQSEEKFSKVFHACPDWIIIDTVRDGRFMDVNDAFVSSTGYEREELVDQTSVELGCWVDRGQRQKLIDAAWRDGGVRNWQVHFRAKNGLARTMLWSAEIVIIGEEECLLSIARDITEQKENERKLFKSKADLAVKHAELTALFRQVETVKREWEATLDCIRDVVILTDSEERIKRCNQSVVQIAGRPYGEIVGKKWQEIVPPSETEGQSRREFFHKPSGRWFHINYYPFREGGRDDITGAVITLHDTTEIKKVHEELERAYAELKETQTQMLQKEKMASIGQLAAGVAHEINNPIGFIMSNLGSLGKYAERLTGFINAQSDVILSHGDQEEEKKVAAARKQLKIDHITGDIGSLIAESIDGAQRVKKIVADLKSFSRVDEAEHKVADLHECLDSTINIVWNELKYKATLKKEYGEIPSIHCYPQQLNQVFMNLLVNAAHAIDNQGEIAVRTWQEKESVFVSVSDTGCGIPEDIRSRIFEPFFTTKEVGKGTGLGLSISYDIVKKHGGEITVDSEVGKGTAFTVRLPVPG